MTKEIKTQSKKVTKETLHKHLAEEYEKDHETFSGKFRYIENKGQILKFRFKKYKQDDYKQYSLKDGETYNLPRMVIDHLNNNVHYRQYKELKGLSKNDSQVIAAFNDGTLQSDQTMVQVSKEPRCEFVPVDFLSGDKLSMLPNKIVEIAAV